MTTLLFISVCEIDENANKHVNDILKYKTSTTNIPEWVIDCPTQNTGYDVLPYTCQNWYCFKPGTPVGSIKTTLSGNARGKLDFGNCYTGGVVKVFLDNTEIASAPANTTSKTIEFDYYDGNELKLVEENTGIIMFNSFEVLDCEM